MLALGALSLQRHISLVKHRYMAASLSHVPPAMASSAVAQFQFAHSN